MKQRIIEFRRKRPVFFGIASGVFLAAGTAAAAFAIYSLTVGGTSTGNFATGTNLGSAVTGAGSALSGTLDQGQSVTQTLTLTNHDSVVHTVSTFTPTVTTKSSSNVDDTSICGPHITVTESQSPVGRNINPGAAITDTETITADATTPNSCAGGTWTVAYGGTVS